MKPLEQLRHGTPEPVQPHLPNGSRLGWTCSLQVFGDGEQLDEAADPGVFLLQLVGEAELALVLLAMR